MGMIRALLRSVIRRRPDEKAARFRLIYDTAAGSLTVGHLSFADGWWDFKYDSDYRRLR
jgi:hypothetical protein